jgi:hypothetical protein
MSFLKKFGVAVLKGLGVVQGISPLLQIIPGLPPQAQVISKDLAQIADVIQTVEVIAQKLPTTATGPQKLTMAEPLVAQALLQSSLFVNQKVLNADLFNSGASKIADGMADILNSLHGDGVIVTSNAA